GTRSGRHALRARRRLALQVTDWSDPARLRLESRPRARRRFWRVPFQFRLRVLMQERQSPGDTEPGIFRKQLHQLADWVADFRENISSLRVAPNNKPGAIRAALPAQPPEEGEAFDKILGDVDRLIIPGMVHWSHPMFLGYFGWT